MNSPNTIERSWWKRLARRKRAEAPRTNRLSHFEPLEQRTVLSASIFVPGGGDFFQTQHDPFLSDGGVDRYAIAPHHEFAYHDPSYAPHSPVTEPLYAPQSLAPPAAFIGALSHELESSSRQLLEHDSPRGEGESTLTASTPAAPFVTVFAPEVPRPSSYKLEIVIVHDDAPLAQSAIVIAQPIATRVSYFTPTYISAADSGVFASLYAAAMQRRVEPTPGSYGTPPRLGSLNAMSEDPSFAAGKSLESTLQSTSASLLATLGTGSGINPSASGHLSMADDGGSSEHVLAQKAAARSSGDESDGLIELSPEDLANQKRKLAASSESRAAVNTRLEQLTDIPVIRISESLFRDLLAMYDNNSPASAHAAQATGEADDGLIELIAADAGSLASRDDATPASDHSQPVTAESGIALYQTLEVAGLDDVAEVAAATQSQAAPVAPAEQLAKAE